MAPLGEAPVVNNERNSHWNQREQASCIVTSDTVASQKVLQDAGPGQEPWGTPTASQEDQGLFSPGPQPRDGGRVAEPRDTSRGQ